MLRTAFIGNENFYDKRICEWLSQHTDLSLIIWSDKMAWTYNGDGQRRMRTVRRLVKRSMRYGVLRAMNEALYYLLYRTFLLKGEVAKIKSLVSDVKCAPRKPLSEIRQIRPDRIDSQELQRVLESRDIDAMFAMCIDVYLPDKLVDTPRYGTFLWHEGVTPEYRGVYSPFWALVNKDYDNLGFTLLKMNSKLDAGAVYLQGRVQDIDIQTDWHSYIGHKAVLDSLPEAENFLVALAKNEHSPICRPDAKDAYYSYPTASKLIQLLLRRQFSGRLGKSKILATKA